MLFNSIQFVFFLPAVVLMYFLLPHKLRWILLLMASYLFYMAWKVEYAVLIMATTLIDYYAALQMEKHSEKKNKLLFLGMSLFANLGLLFIFKYFNFFADSMQGFTRLIAFEVDMPHLNLLLPVGISFYTLQSLSYLFDVYKGKQKAERHLGYFAVYVSFFPQLIAGPIERYGHLAPQFRLVGKINYGQVINGMRLILYGLFMKMVIADNLSVYVDRIYDNPTQFGAGDIWISYLFYSFQIYGDFYGYSIIAIGSAMLLGIRLTDNFKTPYLSVSVAEFWRRWHISLGSWFRDYLYITLGGNRAGTKRWIINIVIVFLISGFWHGANLTFLFWGLIFGLLYLAEKLVNSLDRVRSIFRFSFIRALLVIKTFVIVSIAWVFFRSSTIAEAFDLLKLSFGNNVEGIKTLQVENFVWFFLVIFILSDILLRNTRFDKGIDALPVVFRWLIYFFLIFSIIVFARVGHAPFIYFQF